MGGLGGISGAQRGAEGAIGPQLAEFVLKQMQDRVQQQGQYEADTARYNAGLMASPSQIAQLASSGLLGQVDINDPYAVALALQQGGNAREISNSLKAQLHGEGIDWKKYRFDDLGARIALSDKKKNLGVSDAELRRLLSEALK